MVSKVLRVAIVDDEPHVLRGLRRLLHNEGFEVDTYESGDSFLRLAADQEPDCLVLDLHMPQMNGFALQMQLAQSARHIPVVVITGDDTPEARAQALSLGASSFLRKPVGKAALLPAIHAAIESAVAQRRLGS